MRRALVFVVELACWPFDSRICAVANLTDEPEMPQRLDSTSRAGV